MAPPSLSPLHSLGPNVTRASKQRNIRWMMPVVLSMQFGVYIRNDRVQHGYVPMPLRLLVQHFLNVIFLTGRGLAEALLDW